MNGTTKIFAVGSVTTARIGNPWDTMPALEAVLVRVVGVQDRAGLVYCVESLSGLYIGMASVAVAEDIEVGCLSKLVCKASVKLTVPSDQSERISACRMFGFDASSFYRKMETEQEDFLEGIEYYFGKSVAATFKVGLNGGDPAQFEQAIADLRWDKESRDQFDVLLARLGSFKYTLYNIVYRNTAIAA